MRAGTAFAICLIASCLPALAQSPFQFREGFLLEHRIETTRSGDEYDPHHSEQLLSRTVHGPTNPFAADRDDPNIYRSERWKEILEQTDRYRRMGGLELAQQEYLDILQKLRTAQGPESDNVALMLDHLGEFYLEVRNFDQAYKTFEEALRVRRATIAALPPEAAQAQAASVPGFVQYHAYRLHLADLQSRLGQLDLARGDLARANERLTEAISIFNEPMHHRFVGGLYAVYFQSLVLEKQQKGTEAEALWRDTIDKRSKLFASEPYWNAQKELAAFYARKGDFHAAAESAQKVLEGIAGKTLRPEAPMPYLDSRPRAVVDQPQYSLYSLESNTAMSEILALDKWRTDGPDAAAPLLKDLIVPQNRDILDRGSDSERTQLLAWFGRRLSLHLSILLDGSPSQERIDKAYSQIAEIKGRYLALLSATTRMVEAERSNPNTQIPQFAILDQLAKARESHSHLFVQSALNGQKADPLAFAASENAERILASALLAGPGGSAQSYFSIRGLTQSVPADAAYIDIVAWDRTGKSSPHREYGAFVARRSQPLQFIALGPADSIDADIDALHAGVLGGRQRGLQVETPAPPKSSIDIPQKLKSLYNKVLHPLEPALTGAHALYIVPDGKLTIAPISAFLNPQGHYVFESTVITYLGSWRDLFTTVILGSSTPTAPAIVADPDFDLALQGTAAPANAGRPVFRKLPGAEAEAADIAQALHVPADRVLIGKAARQTLVASLQSPATLHFATHSVPHFAWAASIAPPVNLFEFPQSLDTEYPLLQSFIALAGANRPQQSLEDGLLTGLEIGSMHLQGTHLVVLSSCESGQGTLMDGQGVLGLRAAFSMAGAQNVVMTLWPVDDQAGRQFMQFFYAHLDRTPAEALRLAQQQMQAMPEYKNPFYWSGYVVSGNPVTARQQSITRPQAPAQSATTASAPPETLTAPRCFDFEVRDPSTPAYVTISDIRIKIGGVVHRTQTSPSQVDYDLTAPGNELEVHEKVSVNNGPPAINPDVVIASERHWAVDLLVDHTSAHSSVTFLFGPANATPDQRRKITLAGPASLFPSFDIPESLPALSSFTRATYSYGNDAPITQLGFCASPSLH